MSEVVQRTIDDGVAVLTLNRPDRLNAWTGEMERAYFALLEDCATREDVRAIVVTGAGRGFCAGADMDDLQAIGDAGLEAADHDRRPQTFALTVPKPVIAAINGPCAGIGLVQALMCDIRFAANGAEFTTAIARRGLLADGGEVPAGLPPPRPRRRARHLLGAAAAGRPGQGPRHPAQRPRLPRR